MSDPIKIMENPSLLQMQEMQYEITKRMNAFLIMTTRLIEQNGAAAFTFAGQNSDLQLPTLYDLIKEINSEKAKLSDVTATTT